MKSIKFLNSPHSYNPDYAFVAHLSSVRSKEELLKQLNDELKFPDYFGFNWDALLDVLCDFHWIEQRWVVLVHDELPILDNNELRIYFEILFNAIKAWQDWKEGGEHSFEIVFPESAKDLIKQYIL